MLPEDFPQFICHLSDLAVAEGSGATERAVAAIDVYLIESKQSLFEMRRQILAAFNEKNPLDTPVGDAIRVELQK